MDEIAKFDARNYLCAAGFFLIALIWGLSLSKEIGGVVMPGLVEQADILVCIFVSLALFLVSALLIILKKRDMIAMLFIAVGFYIMFRGFSTGQIWNIFCLGFMVLVTLIIITGQDKKKWLLFLIPTILFVDGIFDLQYGFNILISAEYSAFIVALSLYYALCCASDKVNIPGRSILVADENTDFKKSGNALCYLLCGFGFGIFAFFYFIGDSSVVSLEMVTLIKILISLLLIIIAVLNFVIGKKSYESVFFMAFGTIILLSAFVSGYMIIGVGILALILGIIAVMRKRSYLLLGILTLFFFVTCMISAIGGDLLPSIPWLSTLLNGLACLIAIYLAFASFSQKGFPKI